MNTVTARTTAGDRTRLTGWGRTHVALCRVVRPDDPAAVTLELAGAQGPLIPRGSGSAYGDAATRARGTVVDVSALRRLVALDGDRGVAVVEAGMTLGELLHTVAPRGWVPPVLPGTPHVSVGGAVAADIHGKNHVGAGSIGRHVRWLVVADASGEPHRLTPGHDPGAFWATVGGMGLTGVITTVALQLLPAGPGPATLRRHRAGDLDEVLGRLASVAERQCTDPLLHSVAWLDGSARGSARGRGLVQTTRLPEPWRRRVDPAPADPGPSGPPRTAPRRRAAPSLPGPGVVTRGSIAAMNRARWLAPVADGPRTASIASALQPLRRADDWPSLFGCHGLVQYQFVVPTASVDAIGAALALVAGHRVPPALAVLKRLGPADPAPLTFALDGWTLALDLPARWPGLEPALTELDELVVEAGGRVYLAKDSRLRASTVARMYPRLAEWQGTRDLMDPRRVLGSDLSRRVHLTGPRGTP